MYVVSICDSFFFFLQMLLAQLWAHSWSTPKKCNGTVISIFVMALEKKPWLLNIIRFSSTCRPWWFTLTFSSNSRHIELNNATCLCSLIFWGGRNSEVSDWAEAELRELFVQQTHQSIPRALFWISCWLFEIMFSKRKTCLYKFQRLMHEFLNGLLMCVCLHLYFIQ